MKGRPGGGRRGGPRPGIAQRQPALARLEARLEAWAERTEGTRQRQVIEQLGKLMFGDEWHDPQPEGAGARTTERRPGPEEGGRGE